MSLEENEVITHRHFKEAYNQRNIGVLDETIDENIINHWWKPEINGLQTIKEYVSNNLIAFIVEVNIIFS